MFHPLRKEFKGDDSDESYENSEEYQLMGVKFYLNEALITDTSLTIKQYVRQGGITNLNKINVVYDFCNESGGSSEKEPEQESAEEEKSVMTRSMKK
jgi:hypothetical protein